MTSKEVAMVCYFGVLGFSKIIYYYFPYARIRGSSVSSSLCGSQGRFLGIGALVSYCVSR